MAERRMRSVVIHVETSPDHWEPVTHAETREEREARRGSLRIPIVGVIDVDPEGAERLRAYFARQMARAHHDRQRWFHRGA